MNRRTYVLHAALLLLLSCELPTASTGQSSEFDKLALKMARGTVDDITTKQLYENQEKYLIFDTREKAEYDISHIKGAKWLGYDSFNEEILDGVSKDSSILVYCSVGYRSEKMGEKLQGLGFTNVHNLLGSLFLWSNNGYPMVNSLDEPTEDIHGYNRYWAKWLKTKKIVLD